MKITQNTPDLLIADDTPWIMALLLLVFTLVFVAVGLFTISGGNWLGLMFIVLGGGMGIGAMAFLVERLQIILDGRAGRATIRSRTMIRYKETMVPLDDVRQAVIEKTYRSRGGGPPMTRPSLVVADGDQTKTIPVTEIYTSGRATKNLVPVINKWLEIHRGN